MATHSQHGASASWTPGSLVLAEAWEQEQSENEDVLAGVPVVPVSGTGHLLNSTESPLHVRRSPEYV